MADDRSSSSENEDIPDETTDSVDGGSSKKRKRKSSSTKPVLNGLGDISFQDQVDVIKDYLKNKSYPPGCSQSFRRSLRRRTKAFRFDPEFPNEERLQYGKIDHGLPKPRWLEVVREIEQQKQIVIAGHISDEGHHSGRDVTCRRVTERYYWQTVGQDCVSFVKNCEACQNNTATRYRETTSVGWTPPRSGKVQSGSGVWKQAGVAILGPFPRTAKDNKFIVAMWDYFTKWPEAQALPFTSSLLIARFLYSTMTRYGWIRITFFDEASDFVQEIQEEFSSISKTNQTFHTMEIPEDASLDEPFNSTLMEALSILTRNHLEDWDHHLDWAMYQYRTNKHPIMGYTPFQLLYSRAPYDPNNGDKNCETYEDHVQETGEKKKAMLKDARRILGNARLRQSRKLKKVDEVGSRGPAENSANPSQDSSPNQPQQSNQQHVNQQQPHQTAPQPPPLSSRHQQHQQQQQQQQPQAGRQPPPPPHHSQGQPPLSNPQQTVHQPLPYQHPDHGHIQPPVLSYSYMDLPALPCT